MNEELLVDRPW